MAQRLIDQEERTRKKPMRILVLGMCRTGTTTISAALRKLGYTPHQMREVLVNPSELALWQEAIDVTLVPPQDRPSNRRNQKPYTKPDFDKLLGNYDVVMDLPGCIFAKQLVKVYPDAKVILTTREYADWERSMQESIWCLCTWRLFAVARYFNITQMAPLIRLMYSVFRVHNNNTYGGAESKAAYDSHYDTVRSIVPSNQLLEVDPETMDWAPLCTFLDRKSPEEPWQRMQEDKNMRKYLENAWWVMVQYLAGMMCMPAGAIGLCIVFWVYADAFWEMGDYYVLQSLKNLISFKP